MLTFSSISKASCLAAMSPAAGASGSGWNPSNKAAVFTLTTAVVANDTAESTSAAGGNVFCTKSISSGKYYFECKVVTPSGLYVALAKTTVTTSAYLLNEAYTVVYSASDGKIRGDASNLGFYSTYTTDDVVAFAYDAGTGKIWVSKNNTWQSGNPAAGTGQMYTQSASTAMYPTVFSDASWTKARIITSGTTYSPPSGFSEWGV